VCARICLWLLQPRRQHHQQRTPSRPRQNAQPPSSTRGLLELRATEASACRRTGSIGHEDGSVSGRKAPLLDPFDCACGDTPGAMSAIFDSLAIWGFGVSSALSVGADQLMGTLLKVLRNLVPFCYIYKCPPIRAEHIRGYNAIRKMG